MKSTERRARQRESLRQEILDAARELFVAEGYERVTMRKIADRIGYSPTTIYLHFEDKDDLLGAICDEAFGKLVQRLEKLDQWHPGDPLAQLRAGLHEYADFGLRNPAHYRLVFMQKQPDGLRGAFAGSGGERAFAYLREGVAACVAAGLFREVDVEAAAQSLWAAVQGVVALFVVEKPFPFVSRDALVSMTIDTMIAGLRR